MKKYLQYYRPRLGECWFIILGVILLGGNLAALAVGKIAELFGYSMQDVIKTEGWPLVFTYLIPFVVFFVFLYYRARTRTRLAIQYQVAPYDQPKARFGKLGGITVFLLCLLVVPALGLIAEPLTGWLPMPDFLKQLFGQMTKASFPSFLSVVILAPLCEEAVLRGICLRGMLQHTSYNNRWAAVLWVAVMFGVMHMNPWQAVPAIILGAFFGWIYMRTRSLWLCIFMHAVNNGLSYAVTALFPNISEDATWQNVLPGSWYFLVYAACLLLCAGFIYLLHKKLDPAPQLTPRTAVLESDPSDFIEKSQMER